MRFSAANKVLFLLCIMYFITYVDRVNVGTAAPFIKDELNLSNTQLGFIFSAFAYPYAIFQVFGGIIGDRAGARFTLFFCGLIWAAATILTGLVGGLVSLFAARLLLGFGEGATFPAATRAMQDWTATGKRGFAQGITHSFARLGNAITPPVVAVLIFWTSWRGAFVALGLVSLIWVFVWVWYFRDDPKSHSGMTEADLSILPPYKDRPGAVRRKIPWKRLTLRMLPVTLTYFCYGWTLWLLLNWLPSFFKEGYHLDIKSSAIFASGVFFAGVVGDTAGGGISDALLRRTGNVAFARLSVIVSGLLMAAFCLLGIVLGTRDITTIAILLSGAFFSLELVIGPIWCIPMDIAPNFSGTASGLMNTGSAVAAIVSPIAFGAVVDLTGNWLLPFAASIALLFAGAALAFTMKPQHRFEEDAYPPDVPASSPAE